MTRRWLALAAALIMLAGIVGTLPAREPGRTAYSGLPTPLYAPSHAARIEPRLPQPPRAGRSRAGGTVTRKGKPATRPSRNAAPPGQVESLVRQIAIAAGISPGGFVALCRCESGLRPWADNGGCCAGLTGQHRTYWADRVRRYYGRPASIFDARANATVGARMIRAGMLSHWAPRCRAAYRRGTP